MLELVSSIAKPIYCTKIKQIPVLRGVKSDQFRLGVLDKLRRIVPDSLSYL